MRLLTSHFIICLIVLTGVILVRPPVVVAVVEDFDPTQEYQVRSQSQIEDQPVTTVRVESLSQDISTDRSTPNVFSQISQTFSVYFEKLTYQMARFILYYGAESVMTLFIMSMSFSVGFMLLVDAYLRSQAKTLFKSAFDIHVRLFFSAVAFTTGILSDQSWQPLYATKLLQFESSTGWEVGPLSEDIIWVGGTLAVCGILLGIHWLIAAFGSGFLSSEKLLLTSKNVLFYLFKETKSAFIETEKECKAQPEACQNIVDKGVILTFNYLPGTMPDLDLDDGVISLKKNVAKSQDKPTSPN